MASVETTEKSKTAVPRTAQKQAQRSKQRQQKQSKTPIPTDVSTSTSTFSILPLTFPPVYPTTHNPENAAGTTDDDDSPALKPSYAPKTTHYLYIAPHLPSLPTPTSARSLLLSNVPIDATPTHFRTLFARPEFGGVRIEGVSFDDDADNDGRSANSGAGKKGKKRKRGKGAATTATTAVNEDGEEEERLQTGLPDTWDRRCHRSGSCAVVVFVDVASMERAMKGIRRVVKSGTSVIWGEGVEDERTRKVPALGSERYKTHARLRYPSPTLLRHRCDTYMTSFNALESARTSRLRTRASVPDEDGFVTVTRGARVPASSTSTTSNTTGSGVTGLDSLWRTTGGTGGTSITSAGAQDTKEEERRETKKSRKSEGLTDFYRFQMREEKKKRAEQVRKGFDEDRERVRRMRERRGGAGAGVVPMS